MATSTSNLPHPAFGGTVSAITYNQLVMPSRPEFRAPFYFEPGQDMVAGTVLGMVTATELLKVSEAAATDGSEIPMAILPDDWVSDAVLHSVYVEGYFSEAALTFGTGHDADSVRRDLEKVKIYLQVGRYSYA